MPRSMVVLVHPFDDFWASRYWFASAAVSLKGMGVEVHVCSDPSRCPAADLSVVHVDHTRVAPEFIRAAKRSHASVNADAIDMSKRVVSQTLLQRGDAYDGPVIVKTDRNSSGMKEAVAARLSGWPSRIVRSMHRRLPWYLRAELGGKAYPVFDSIRDVPAIVWRSPWLVVERLNVERDGDFYLLRSCVFFESTGINLLRRGTGPVVRPPFPCDAEVTFGATPADVLSHANRHGFQFGKFDYTCVDGRPYVFDCNRTPTGPSYTQEQFEAFGARLAGGLIEWWRSLNMAAVRA